MVKSLDKKWKEFLYAFSGFGPNFLMVLMGAYFTDAVNPVALGTGTTASIAQAIIPGVCLIMPVLFPILWAIGKAFDGIIDIPFATITDRLSTKWGRRRPAIAVCAAPMIVSFAMCWFPVAGISGDTTSQLINTIWIFVWALIFFATYTMCLIAFYGSLSTTCCDESQRLRVSSYKSFFDTISYCIVYALVPVILGAIPLKEHVIDTFVYCCLPLMLTITIPLFLIKEGKKWGYPENAGLQEKPVKIGESLKLTFGNRTFMRWILVNCCTYFGLQMFLVGMNAMIVGGMGFEGWEMTVVNTCAFAPVPIMLWLFQKVKAKKGIRFTYQTCLLAFGVAILNFFFGSLFITGGVKWIQYLIGCVGGVLASWAIGSFFMMPLMVPAQVSAVEEKLTGKNHSAMYFAAQAVTTSIAGAIASSAVYENIKQLFISKAASGVVWAENIEEAALKFGVEVSQVFNLGTLLVPAIVCLFCIIGFILAFRMPKDYTPTLVAKELKRFNPNLDISAVTEMEKNESQEKGEIIFVQVGLSVLSGFLFGFVWLGFLLESARKFFERTRGDVAWKYLLSSLVPFASIYVFLKEEKEMQKKAQEMGVQLMKGGKILHIIFGILFPIAPLNVVSLSVLQHHMNKLLNAPSSAPQQEALTDAEAVHGDGETA